MSRPTTLFANGALFDGHRYLGDGELLVVDGRIAGIRPGPDGMDRRASSVTEVVDLGGGLLAPGFVDAHVHAVQGADGCAAAYARTSRR
jgi:imidazolonepropionase-like amidohydrolase